MTIFKILEFTGLHLTKKVRLKNGYIVTILKSSTNSVLDSLFFVCVPPSFMSDFFHLFSFEVLNFPFSRSYFLLGNCPLFSFCFIKFSKYFLLVLLYVRVFELFIIWIYFLFRTPSMNFLVNSNLLFDKMSSWCDNHIRFIHRLLFRKAKFLQRVNEFVCLSPFSFFLKIVKLLEAMFVYSFPSLFSSSSIYLCYLPTIVLFKNYFRY